MSFPGQPVEKGASVVPERDYIMSLDLGGHKLKVYAQDVLIEGTDECYGVCDWNNLSITLTRNVPNETIYSETLIHELTHAISFAYALNFSEKTVSLLGMALYQALAPFLDEKKLVRLLEKNDGRDTDTTEGNGSDSIS